jgi:hypothetical protein
VRSEVTNRVLTDGLHDPSPLVRATAADGLAAVDSEGTVQPLVELLADPDSEVRATTARALGRIGPPAVHAVAAALGNRPTESGALLALEQLPTGSETDQIHRYVRESVSRALSDQRHAVRLVSQNNERRLLLHDSLARSAERQALNAIRAVALVSKNSRLVEAVGNLETGDSVQRAAALELIDSSREASVLRPLVTIWEPGQVATPALVDPVPELRHHPDPWVRECAEFAMSTYSEGNPMAKTLQTLTVMERVLFLRKVPIFESLPPEDLKFIAAVAVEQMHADGEVIAAQGEAASDMHIIVSGSVAVVVNGREVARRGIGDVVGEMALILDQPRMATLSASGDVRMLTIRQQEFAGILRERPETSIAVMQVLARRLAERETSPAAS